MRNSQMPPISSSFLLCGMAGVGKTTLVNEIRGIRNNNPDADPTCVCDVIVVPSGGKQRTCQQFTFYDLGGSAKFLTGRISVYSHGFGLIRGMILVFDISDRNSFEALDVWYQELNVVFPLHNRNFIKILVGNKLDKQTLCVSMQEMEIWAEKHGFRICLTAAMDGRGVSEICPYLLRMMEDTAAQLLSEAGDSAMKTRVTPEQIFSVYRIINGGNDWERLGLPSGSNATSVTKAYRRVAAQIHPDKCPVNGSEEAFKLLTASKDALTVPGYKLQMK